MVGCIREDASLVGGAEPPLLRRRLLSPQRPAIPSRSMGGCRSTLEESIADASESLSSSFLRMRWRLAAVGAASHGRCSSVGCRRCTCSTYVGSRCDCCPRAGRLLAGTTPESCVRGSAGRTSGRIRNREAAPQARYSRSAGTSCPTVDDNARLLLHQPLDVLSAAIFSTPSSPRRRRDGLSGRSQRALWARHKRVRRTWATQARGLGAGALACGIAAPMLLVRRGARGVAVPAARRVHDRRATLDRVPPMTDSPQSNHLVLPAALSGVLLLSALVESSWLPEATRERTQRWLSDRPAARAAMARLGVSCAAGADSKLLLRPPVVAPCWDASSRRSCMRQRRALIDLATR